MSEFRSEPLAQRHCKPCEGGVPKLSPDRIRPLAAELPGWQVDESSQRIWRKLQFRNFVAAVDFINRVAEVAEAQQHHPDLHLTGYRQLRIDLTTHAIGGLSENDFILAARIDAIAPQQS